MFLFFFSFSSKKQCIKWLQSYPFLPCEESISVNFGHHKRSELLKDHAIIIFSVPLSPTDAKGETSKILDAQTKLNQTIPLAFRTPWLLYVCVCVYKGLVKLKIMSFSKRRKNMIVSQEQGESQIAQNKHNHHYFKFHSMLGFKIGTIWVIIMPMVKFSHTMLAELFTLLFLLQDIANR